MYAKTCLVGEEKGATIGWPDLWILGSRYRDGCEIGD